MCFRPLWRWAILQKSKSLVLSRRTSWTTLFKNRQRCLTDCSCIIAPANKRPDQKCFKVKYQTQLRKSVLLFSQRNFFDSPFQKPLVDKIDYTRPSGHLTDKTFGKKKYRGPVLLNWHENFIHQKFTCNTSSFWRSRWYLLKYRKTYIQQFSIPHIL